jgi:succinyl-CoA synthetase beta subunit
VEINPLVITEDNRLLALDAKIEFDDNALYRHKELLELEDSAEQDPLDLEASRHRLNYIRLDGDLGIMVNGAGLAMARASHGYHGLD